LLYNMDCFTQGNCHKKSWRYQIRRQLEEKGQKDKQRSTEHAQKTKDRATQTPLTT
jgi:hypothetical protein